MLRTSVFDDVDLKSVNTRQRRAVRESVIENALVRDLTAAVPKAEIKKIDATVPGWRTWPDRISMVRGLPPHFLELKRPKGGRYEPGQERRHSLLRDDYGIAVFIVLDQEGVKQYVHTVRTCIALNVTSSAFVELSKVFSCKVLASLNPHQTSCVSAGTPKVRTGSPTKRRRT